MFTHCNIIIINDGCNIKLYGCNIKLKNEVSVEQ